MNETDKNDITKTYRDVGPYLGLGTQLAATMVLMFFVGRLYPPNWDSQNISRMILTYYNLNERAQKDLQNRCFGDGEALSGPEGPYTALKGLIRPLRAL